MAARFNMSAEVAIEHARQLLRTDRHDEMLEFLDEIVENFPDNPEIRLLYGTALVAFRPSEAPEEIVAAIELDPDHAWRRARAASLLTHLGELDLAFSYAKRAAELAPDDVRLIPEVVSIGAKIAARRGNRENAEYGFRAAFEAEPEDPLFAVDLANFLVEDGRHGEALAVIDEALPITRDRAKLVALRDRIASAD